MTLASNASEATIQAAAYAGDLASVKRWTERDPGSVSRVDEDQRTALHWAASGKHVHVAEFLVENGAKIDPLDDAGWSPLMIATSVGSAPFADFLLQREADVNLANENKQTPLFYAASKGWLNICELLISRGARINVRDHLRQTPLHRACAKGNLACVKLLLAQPNIQLDHEDRDGNTALHIAVENGYGEVAVLLVEGGADVESQNGEKKRPLDLVPDKQLKVYLERAWAAVGNK